MLICKNHHLEVSEADKTCDHVKDVTGTKNIDPVLCSILFTDKKIFTVATLNNPE